MADQSPYLSVGKSSKTALNGFGGDNLVRKVILVTCFCPESIGNRQIMAGLLTCFPCERLPILISSRTVAGMLIRFTKLTAAGTVADLHGIPF